MDLFRREVIEARPRRLHGDVILQQSLPTRIATSIIVIVVAGAVLWVVMGRYARTEIAKGMLVPVGGYAKIFARRTGVITKLLVADGDQVKAGQKLVVVKIEEPNANGALESREELGSISNQTALASQQILLSDQRAQREQERQLGLVDGLRKQLSTIKDQIELQTQVVTSMSTSFSQIGPVVEKGYISKIDYERRRQELLSAQEELSRLHQQAAATESDISKSEKEQSQATLAGKTDKASALSAFETLRQQRTKIEAEESYSIEAPVSGRVTTVQVSLGSNVENNVPLMAIVPEGASLRADLFVPSRAIGFVKHGQEVRLLYDAFPYQRFGSYVAHVDAVSRLAIAGSETGAPFKIEEPVYRVTAILDRQQINAYGEHVTLQPGMTLAANIILARQSFLDWILDPLRAVSNRN